MMRRCYNPKHVKYLTYGARGITVEDRWHTYANFLQDMGERPDKHTLDRKNPYQGYYKNNCRWATAKEQRANTRKAWDSRNSTVS